MTPMNCLLQCTHSQFTQKVLVLHDTELCRGSPCYTSGLTVANKVGFKHKFQLVEEETCLFFKVHSKSKSEDNTSIHTSRFPEGSVVNTFPFWEKRREVCAYRVVKTGCPMSAKAHITKVILGNGLCFGFVAPIFKTFFSKITWLYRQ